MVFCPFPPERRAEVSRGAQDVVSCDGCRAVLFPGAPVAADGYDPVGTSVDDRAMAPARVIGTIRGDGIHRFVWWDLLQQFRQQGAVSLAARSEFDGEPRLRSEAL